MSLQGRKHRFGYFILAGYYPLSLTIFLNNQENREKNKCQTQKSLNGQVNSPFRLDNQKAQLL